MEVLYPHCAGLDVHKDMVVACLRHMVNGTVEREVRTVKTTTKAFSTFAMAFLGRLHPYRHGGDRGLLEAGLAHSRRWRFRAGAGQCGPCEERAGPQDRRQRCDLAGRSSRAWARSGAASCRMPRPRRCAACCAPASNSSASGPAMCNGCRRRWRTPTSSSIGHLRCRGTVRPGDDRGADRRRDRSRQAGRTGPSADQGVGAGPS